MSNRKQMLKRAESELAEISPGQRAELLKAAGIGPASQARALGAAFRMLEQAVYAESSVRVGKGGNGRLAKRPDWPTRVASSRTLIEWLAPVMRQTPQSGGGRPTQVAVVLQGFAGGSAVSLTPEMVQPRVGALSRSPQAVDPTVVEQSDDAA